jgi:hypothetical protein
MPSADQVPAKNPHSVRKRARGFSGEWGTELGLD